MPESSSSKRQSVDWYAGLAADQGVGHVHLPPTVEENEDELKQKVTSPVPQIQVSEPKPDAPAEVVDDPVDDVDKSIGTDH
jgi:hypothetical protein